MPLTGYLNNQCPHCGTSLQISTRLVGTLCRCRSCSNNFVAPATGVVPGQTVGDFWLVKRIGGTPRSDVFAATHMPTETRLAMKVLSPLFALDQGQLQDYVEFFKRDELVVRPEVVPYQMTGKILGHLYLAAPLLEAEDLRRRLHRIHILPESTLLRLALTLARTLDSVWTTCRVAHGTMKPGNILATEDDSVRLTEFGFYNLLVRNGNLPSPNDTEDAAYMSPEQAEGGEADNKSDMYAFGATLYHLATAAKPLSPYNLNLSYFAPDAADEGADEPLFPPVREINPKISAEFSDLVARLLAFAPEDRPDCWAHVSSALQTLVDDGGTGAETQSLPAGPGPGAHRDEPAARGRRPTPRRVEPRPRWRTQENAARRASMRSRQPYRWSTAGRLLFVLLCLLLLAGSVVLGYLLFDHWQSTAGATAREPGDPAIEGAAP